MRHKYDIIYLVLARVYYIAYNIKLALTIQYTNIYIQIISLSMRVKIAKQITLLMIVFIFVSREYKITIVNSTDIISVTDDNGDINNNFIADSSKLTCIIPSLFIFNDTTHESYRIVSEGVAIESIVGKYRLVKSQIVCKDEGGCVSVLENGCEGSGKNQMNWVTVNLGSGGSFEYLVNCNPNQYYKPFQWGLFILIFFCTITITASSFYSRAWSYKGYGINVNYTFIICFNAIVIVASIFAYYFPHLTSIWLKVMGSGVGTLGVAVCTSQTLWLLKNRKLNEARLSMVRLLDVVALATGILVTALYWLTNGMWIANDVLAVCTIVASIKLLKIRSLKNGMFMLYSLLLIEIILGVIVHYFLKMSYNNLVIQMFESPLVIVFPSITPELLRKCAWLPITSIVFPGLFISYLRRFDKSRGTFLYLFIGYGSFYVGSLLWMIVDMNIKHALPLAIISDPITTITVFIFASRRNELKTIWNGLFFDTQLPDVFEDMLPTKSNDYIAFQQITQNLKIDNTKRGSQITDGQI